MVTANCESPKPAVRSAMLPLIEAMKVFNPILAPKAGKVVKILVRDGMPVEYGEPLVIVE